MNYSIIQDEKLLRGFVDWLPELKAGEMFYVSLLARKKYCADRDALKADKQQLKRFTATKDRLIDKIRQLECAQNSYTSNGAPVPPESLALYINPNPRSLELASKNTLVRLAELITKPYDGYNPHTVAMSEIQKATSHKVYFDMDFDLEHPEIDTPALCAAAGDHINMDCVQILHTRGGVHLLVELSKIQKQYEKSWYRDLTRLPGCDVKGDNMIPVVGCIQGGFVPHF